MHKLKNSYIDRMVDNQISSKEVDFILEIAKCQDETGLVASVYYKDLCQAINISTQKFYDILNSLTEKHLIICSKPNHADVCVRLIGNDFSGKDFYKGYLNVASMNFAEDKFRELKAGSKLLYLYMQRYTNGKHMLVQNFYDEFCELFHVARRSLQNYIKELKDRFYLFINKKRNKSMNYEMMMKNSSVLRIPEPDRTNEKEGYLSNISDLIQRNFRLYLPDGDGEREKIIRDIVNLGKQQRNASRHDFHSLIVKAIWSCIGKQKKEGRKKPVINAALTNRYLTAMI